MMSFSFMPLVSCVVLAAELPRVSTLDGGGVLAEGGKPGVPAKPGVPGKPPAPKKSVEERVREIVVEQLVSEELGVKKEAVTLKARLREDLKADSLDMVEMVLAWEEAFEVSIPDEVAGKFETVGDVVSYLTKVVK